MKGCSYCGGDIVAGETFQAHNVREGRFIHTSCLDEHDPDPDVRIRFWGDEEVEQS